MRQEVRDLVEEIDSKVVFFDADMDMHSTDQQSVRDDLHVLVQHAVSQLVCVPSALSIGRRDA